MAIKVLKPFDSFSFMMKWEQEEMEEAELVEGFQYLIDTGLAWQLQGCYGRQAMALIAAGLCHK
jgi:hypothetical protein